MTKCTVLKNFNYSLDGIKAHSAKVGQTPDPDIPADLIEGLRKEGFISLGEVKSVAAAPENKMFEPVIENKQPETVEVVEDDAYTAKDVGRGWFAVFSGDVEIKAVKKMRKDDAEAFMAMSNEDRAEYVVSEIAE